MRSIERHRRPRREQERRRFQRRRPAPSDDDTPFEPPTPPRPPSHPWLADLDLAFELPAHQALSALSVGDARLGRDLHRQRLIGRFMWWRGLQLSLETIWGALATTLHGATWGAMLGGVSLHAAFLIADQLRAGSPLVATPLALVLLATQALPVAVIAARLVGDYRERWRERPSGAKRAARRRLTRHLLSRLAPGAVGDVSVFAGGDAWALSAPIAGGRALVRVDEGEGGPSLRLWLQTERPRALGVAFPAGLRPEVRAYVTERGQHVLEVGNVRAADLLDHDEPEVALADLVGQAVAPLAEPRDDAWEPAPLTRAADRVPLRFRRPPLVAKAERATGLHARVWGQALLYVGVNLALLAASLGWLAGHIPGGSASRVALAVGVTVGLCVWGLEALFNAPTLPSWRQEPVHPARRAGALSLDGALLHTGCREEGVDLDQPFQVHLSRDPGEVVEGGWVWVTLDVRQRRGAGVGRVRVSTRLPAGVAMAQLPALSTAAPSVAPSVFQERLWPLIQRKARMHGLVIDGEAALGGGAVVERVRRGVAVQVGWV